MYVFEKIKIINSVCNNMDVYFKLELNLKEIILFFQCINIYKLNFFILRFDLKYTFFETIQKYYVSKMDDDIEEIEQRCKYI